jgi:diguanylate cyclase (GGDEF)-like protein
MEDAMAGQRLQTAPIQAAVLFALAGSLGLVTETLLAEEQPRAAGIAVNLFALVCALAIYAAPWPRWRPRASLVIVPLALGLVMVGQRVAPGAPTVYGLWFVVIFAWIGFWNSPRTSLLFAPLGAITYVAPFIGTHTTPRDAIASVAIAIPAAAVLGEVLSSKMDTINRAQRELLEARTLLERANLTDDLTGVGNRRRANSLLDALQPGDGLLMLDLDHFKHVNDTLGHAEGDRVLSLLGEYLRGAVREADTVARFGGEEFLVVMRGAGHQISDAAGRLLAGWRDYGGNVTLSAGGAVHVAGRGPDETFRAADAAMYEAKHTGRDRLLLEPVDAVPALAEDAAT